jgi:lipopolysaccharide transport system ATP-binding protein
MHEVAIRVEGLGKRYRLGERQAYRALRDVLGDALKAPARLIAGNGHAPSASAPGFLWALDDVSLDVRAGEVVGLIGRNGSGKTTLLKILSRITRPTRGRAEVYGRVGSLLEVGTGFHAELTGRENTFLNGAILGMSKREIARKFDEIVAFAEIERFIDTPVKHYSSGMYVRLAFSVAAHLEPEILLVDEVLAVGDLSFQKKCLGKMNEVAQRGRTVVFVSHQMNQIRRLCGRVALLDAGRVVTSGPTAEVIAQYEAATLSGAARGNGDCTAQSKARFLRWEIAEPRSEPANFVTAPGPVRVKFTVEVRERLRAGQLSIALFTAGSDLVWAWASEKTELEPGMHDLLVRFPYLPLRPGSYTWDPALWEDGAELDHWACVPPLVIATENYQHHDDKWNGLLNLPCDFSVRPMSGEDQQFDPANRIAR